MRERRLPHRQISIHAPRVRCDKMTSGKWSTTHYFNPRTSCEVRQARNTCRAHAEYISIHAPRVRCDKKMFSELMSGVIISIHAPRVRCDNSTRCRKLGLSQISIHAPRVRCDVDKHDNIRWNVLHFNPRTSCEVRLPTCLRD